MKYEFGKNMLSEKHFLISNSTLQSCWKKVRSHNFKYETLSHFLSKAVLVYLINKKTKKGNQHGACSEFTFPSGRTADVLHLMMKDREMVGYEIQTSNDKKKPYPDEVPIIEIDLSKAPENVHNAFKILEEYFKKYII